MVSLSPTRPGPSRGSTQVTPAERAAGSQPTALPVACCWASPDGKCARRHGVLLGPALATPGTPGLAYVHRLCTCRRRGATHGRSPVPAPRARRGHRPTSSPVEVDRRSALPFPRPEGSSAVPDAQRREARPGDGRPPGAARLDRPARQPFHPRNDGHLLALFRWRDGRSMGRTMGLFHGLDYRSNTGTTAQCVNRDTVTGFYKNCSDGYRVVGKCPDLYCADGRRGPRAAGSSSETEVPPGVRSYVCDAATGPSARAQRSVPAMVGAARR